jgi:hypothetical protein
LVEEKAKKRSYGGVHGFVGTNPGKLARRGAFIGVAMSSWDSHGTGGITCLPGSERAERKGRERSDESDDELG